MSIRTISMENGQTLFLWICEAVIHLYILREIKFILSAMELTNQMEEAVFSSVRSISQPEND